MSVCARIIGSGRREANVNIGDPGAKYERIILLQRTMKTITRPSDYHVSFSLILLHCIYKKIVGTN